MRGALGDVVAGDGRDGDGDGLAEAEAPHQGAEVVLDLAEAAFGPVDEVHFVDGQDDALQADEVEDGGVAARLGLDAVAGVDEHDGDVGVRGAGSHVARVLFVSGAVDDDEAARLGVEIAPGDVDGDALFALGDEAVHQKREIRMSAIDAAAAFERGALIVEQVGGVPEQTADECGFAIVDGAAGEDAEQAGQFGRGLIKLIGSGLHERCHVRLLEGRLRGHQKYPSCFFFSMAPT